METELSSSETFVQKQKAEALDSLITGPLASSAARLLSRSRGLPLDKDFHFYNNFDEFKLPVRKIASKVESSLRDIASSISLWESKRLPALPDELDDAYEWLVNLNDDFLEKFGISMDEFRSFREKHELNGGAVDSGDGFQVVSGRKKKREIVVSQERCEGFSPPLGIKMVSKDMKTMAARAKVPFHLPNIPKPQNEYNILVNNKNLPFEHVWLEMSEDRSHFMHPLEKLSVVDFVDRNINENEIIKPLSLERTPFTLVEGMKELKEMAGKLREVNEFAVDLEHNNYRSFLGLTCLMQISTRTEDFIVDALKLRVHIGPYLRELFKDPLKRKVMHGADRDILWLQRDFGMYICNLFDTGQASKLLQLDRNSLEHLLHHFCGVEANKEYQNADWRIRPLPNEMIKYAREDTHYLLYIYDLMSCKLLSSSSNGNDLLLEVYKRSSEVCMQFYEKELWTDTSYLHIYGLSEAGFDSKQLAIVSGLCEWRDKIAREEDESTGYILPNKGVLEIAKQMPQTSGNLRRLVKSKHPYVNRQLNVVLRIIRHAVANSFAFEGIAQELGKKPMEALRMQDKQPENTDSVTPTEHAMESPTTERNAKNAPHTSNLDSFANHAMSTNTNHTNHSSDQNSVGTRQEEKKTRQMPSSNWMAVGTVEKEMDNEAALSSQLREKTTLQAIPTASVQAMKRPAGGFGALFGNPSWRKSKPLNGNVYEKGKNESKLEEIKASVILPFYSFSSREENVSETCTAENAVLPPQTMPCPEQSSKTTIEEDVLLLESSDEGSQAPTHSPHGESKGTKSNADVEESHLSMTDLSSGFQQCSQFSRERKGLGAGRHRSSQGAQLLPELTPFNYSTARQSIKFGEGGREVRGEDDGSMMTNGRHPASLDARKGSRSGGIDGAEREGGQQPRRRQVFPPSGNRSTTYRC